MGREGQLAVTGQTIPFSRSKVGVDMPHFSRKASRDSLYQQATTSRKWTGEDGASACPSSTPTPLPPHGRLQATILTHHPHSLLMWMNKCLSPTHSKCTRPHTIPEWHIHTTELASSPTQTPHYPANKCRHRWGGMGS